MTLSKFIYVLILVLGFCFTLQAKPGREFYASDILKEMETGDKLAILMVHFGSAYPEARTKVLDVMNQQVQANFPGVEVCQAYSARSLVKRLRNQGVYIQNPVDALVRLRDAGYTHVIVQPTIIIEGVEMEALRKDMEMRKGLFKDLRIGNPLLYDDTDYESVIRTITTSPVANQKGAKVLAAHGTYHASNSAYAMLGYMFQTMGKKDYFTGTQEGFPTIQTVTEQLRKGGYKQVTLIPFMFVLIRDKDNAISKFWQEGLKKEGFSVTISPKGLGEYSGIRKLIVQHIRFAMQYKRVTVQERKKLYAH